jgi:hypothetical protein
MEGSISMTVTTTINAKWPSIGAIFASPNGAAHGTKVADPAIISVHLLVKYAVQKQPTLLL